ncbi:SDR family NAD(P)-dependent oxidoreductase [Amnibacterium setariae]|uniref:SDR family NAD(P)-dependent oxidoreductase n=1 Tax=Amnibacterium setariae TaxID=2306585 RepID=A0A3A1U2H7_9MICO|nr:SDR family NAD(P)-dependent oxidoreductase [Amnibacterium setariae]RIX28666.1 SDR family NAD(P)-dependent oxidoreductase [Amnibacterium setariae]
MDLTDRSGIITGAGSGIGRELAVQLATRGASLLLVGRRQDALNETAELVTAAGGIAHVFVADVTGEKAPEAIFEQARDQLDTVDLLINNAGNVRAGRLEDTDPADIRAMVDLNLTAPILLTRAALPELRRAASARRALVVTISSGIALVNLPFYTTYAATKTGVAAFGHALRRELHGTGVHVATVYPGATATAMMDSSHAGEALGFGRRTTADVVTDVLAALERDEHEINTALPSRRRLQELHATAPLEVDAALAPQLADLEAAVRSHRSI